MCAAPNHRGRPLRPRLRSTAALVAAGAYAIGLTATRGTIPGYTQFVAATPDGKRSVAVSVNTQLSQRETPELLAKLRKVQEDFVCELFRR
ncbi:hypothetical protein [Streptomyces sp. ISL-100]|uniref:hypothetical protein n=1 Tax=Streptomyces sp. ISL-100 TaxID=2819173 RepID=UPI001BE5734A|nr:hypothetical protein [Streptomyces sp. ISL-100]MBT2398950.1 hypothetical protein [Streptomyces sp. ISL-100]